MSAADLVHWEARWRQHTGQPGAPEPFLVRMAASLPAGPALDVAAGDGRNALWLASRGVPTGLVIYPDEGHGIKQPRHREDVLRRVLEWFEKYDKK